MREGMLKLMAFFLAVKDGLGYQGMLLLRKMRLGWSFVRTEVNLYYQYHLNRLRD